jgi:cell fate (sporulation/competence/biofilm development) regulator YmcA (YheA/YmcA/DUF963 family)
LQGISSTLYFWLGNIKMAIQSESVAQDRTATSDGDQLESAGQAILKLLHKAAGATEANSRQAFATAQKLASQLRAAEDRIAELEAEVQHYREKSERAEDWLRKISAEIEDRLFNESVEKRREALRRP